MIANHKKKKKERILVKYGIHISSRVAGMGANKNSASSTTDAYKRFYNAERRAVLDTAVFRIALVNIEILLLHFCNKSPFNWAVR